MEPPGTLYLVPTPIGNLGDMTYRAVSVLQSVDVIACEDTRTSATLLDHYVIRTPRTAFHQNNEHRKAPELVAQMTRGRNIALVTDAGTPGISDPGFLLVRAAIEKGVRVEALPGATAFVPALAASGLPSDRFVFEGFLPPKKGRSSRIASLASDERTVVLYVSPHKLVRTLAGLREAFEAERPAVLCRELSKKFETYHRGTLRSLADWAASQDRIRGELVLILSGAAYFQRLNRSGSEGESDG